MTGSTRAQRMAMPLARDVVRALAVEHGACIRPIQLRRRNLDTGEIDQVLVPCGHTLASVCPACAERAKSLRAAQCREGWHLEDEPDLQADPATEDQKWWITQRAEAQQVRDLIAAAGDDTADFDELITELDEQITSAGIRGKAAPAKPARRHRSTRRRQDAPDLPRRKVSPRTIGKTYTTPDGKTFRPSLFVTLTCPSYGRVGEDGAPGDPGSYDYDSAARDALAFAALFDRFIQNLRRYLGYDLQYFAAIEPQRRLAPHVHIAMRGTIARTEIRRVLAATYHQVWWPDTTAVKYDGDELPVWDEGTGNYLDPATGEVLPSWDQALDELGDTAPPRGPVRRPVRRPGRARRVQGRQPVHRLPDQVPDQADRRLPPPRDRRRSGRMRPGWPRRCGIQPCSPRCANWLRYGIQPKNARPGLAPGRCKSKAHDADHFGYAGRRVLASRKWSGKTLADHRADRQGVATDDARCFGNRPGPLRLGAGRDRPTRTTWTTRGGCCTPSPTVPGGRAALAEARQRAEGRSDTESVGRAALWRVSAMS